LAEKELIKFAVNVQRLGIRIEK